MINIEHQQIINYEFKATTLTPPVGDYSMLEPIIHELLNWIKLILPKSQLSIALYKHTYSDNVFFGWDVFEEKDNTKYYSNYNTIFYKGIITNAVGDIGYDASRLILHDLKKLLNNYNYFLSYLKHTLFVLKENIAQTYPIEKYLLSQKLNEKLETQTHTKQLSKI